MDVAGDNAVESNAVSLTRESGSTVINHGTININSGTSGTISNRAPEQTESQEHGTLHSNKVDEPSKDDKGIAVNKDSEQRELEGRQIQQQNKVLEPSKDDKDLTWLVKGKIALYKKRPLSKTTKTVFYGRQQVLPVVWREVAIKVIEYEEKNLDELRFLVKLRHPNIVQLIDADERRGDFVDHIYIVMELCSENLRTYVEKNPFDFQKSFSLVKQIAEGLDYLHNNNVTHRDLKPGNVLISPCKKIVKLSDFGLSTEIPVGQSSVTVTKIGVGTEGYRAPETYHKICRVSPSIDIFPFGLVTYFIFTNGKHPFGPTAYKWQVNILNNENCELTQIPQFGTQYAHKREQLIKLLRDTLQHNPSDRPTIKEIKQSVFITDVGENGAKVSRRGGKRKHKELMKDSEQTPMKEIKYVSDTKTGEPQHLESIEVTQATIDIDQTDIEMETEKPPLRRSARLSMKSSTFQSQNETNESTSSTSGNLSDKQSAESPQEIARNSVTFTGVIHEGQFSSLHKGYWKGKLVTIKVFKEGKRQSFERELRNLTAMRHKSVVELFGKISQEPACLVLEYLKNGNLRDYLRRLGNVALSLSDRMNMIRQIACAMTSVSKKKFIHTDLRAKNILVNKAGIYKITGFHLSKSETDDQAELIPPIRWSAPEVLSDGSVSTKSDVWSFGVVLYEIFANGEVPYRGHGDTDVKEKVLFGYRLQRPTGCPESVFKMMSQCWDEDPRDRPEFEKLQVFFEGCEKELHVNPSDDARDIEDGSSSFNMKRAKRIQEIQDELKQPLNEIGFTRSAQLLSELRELRGSDDLDILLQMAECELQLARGKEKESIQRTRDFISTSGWYSAGNVWDMAEEFYESRGYVRSLILYRISHDLRKSQKVSPDDAVKWIRNRVVHVSYAAKPLIKAGGRSRDIGIKYGLECMETLLNDLRSVKNVTSEFRVINEVDCLCSITSICIDAGVAGEYQKSIRFSSEGVEVLEKQFGSDASKRKIYGMLLHNLGYAHHNSGDYSDAERYHVRAIEAKEKALDYENENEKSENTEKTKRNLANTRRFLGKQK